MNFFVSLSLTNNPGWSSKTNEDSKRSKLKSSASLKAESSDKINSDKKIQCPKKILPKNSSYQTQLTKQIIRTRLDLNKLQTDLNKLKGDLEC